MGAMKDNWATMDGFYDRFNIMESSSIQKEKDEKDKLKKEAGAKLKKIRKKYGLTQDQMAKKMGYDSGAIISQIEKGHRTITGVGAKCLKYLEIVLEKK